MKGKGLQFLTIILTLIALFFANNYLLSNLVLSVVSWIAGTDSSAAVIIISYVLSDLIVGILACLPLYFQMRDDGQSHRLLLKFFEENEYNDANMKRFLKGYRINILVFFLSMNLVLLLNYGISITALILYPMSASVIFAPYLVLEFVVRPKLYDKWYRERLHK